jgi:hypothetical protein
VSPLSGREPLLAPESREALLGRLGRLTLDELHALDAAVRALRAEKPYRKRVDMGFWLAWYEGPRLSTAEAAELGDLFGQVVVAIARGVTGLDVERFAARPRDARQQGVFGDLANLFRHPSAGRSLQDGAIGLLEAAVAPWDPRLAIVACWNAACAATLRPHLPPGVVDVLEHAWRQALGELPA